MRNPKKRSLLSVIERFESEYNNKRAFLVNLINVFVDKKTRFIYNKRVFCEL